MSNSYPSPSEWADHINRRTVLKSGGAAGAVVLLGSGLLAACGDDGNEFSGELGSATGTLTVGSNGSDDAPKAGIAAVVAAYMAANPDVTVNINTTDHNTFQENITNTLKAGEDDVLTWFAGFRNKFFADQGQLGDISDVWDAVSGLGSGFKAASTASDGKQYFMPTTYYTWAVNYNTDVFTEMGYTEPNTWDEMLTLAGNMQTDGITPFVAANDGKWPLMGTFDALNMRVNGYDFHIDLMGGNESWTDPRVEAVFTKWADLLPLSQEGANGRTWQEGAQSLQDGESGMFLLGTFAASHSEELAAKMDFFNFPEIDSAVGALSLDAPIDGFQMIAEPNNEAAAKELLLFMSTKASQDAYLSEDPSVVASSSEADTSGYNKLQKKSAQLANAATGISQFLDRDTVPDFAGACGDMFAQFVEDPTGVAGKLGDLEEKKVAIFADFNS